jgi:hypothetical protein
MTASRQRSPAGSRPRWPGSRRARRLQRRRARAWRAAGLIAAIAAATVIVVVLTQGSAPLLSLPFPKANKLITNERAYSDPKGPGVRVSRQWVVTSGSLFSRDGTGWTGVPDDIAPNAESTNGNDSAVFRAVTRQGGFTNATVSFQLRVTGLVTTSRTPAVAYDGVHVFLRYQNPQYLYVVSVFRRDGIVAVKEKIPGGPANGGTYYTLAEARHRVPMNQWVSVHVTIVTVARNAVRITLEIGTRQVLMATVPASRVPPILKPGRVGLRGDNTEFYFRDFEVTAPQS